MHTFVEQYVETAPDKQSGTVRNLFMRLDAAQALANALNCPVLIDERRGRTVAKQMSISIFGTVALFVKANQLAIKQLKIVFIGEVHFG